MKYITMTMLFKYLVLIPQVTALPPLEKDIFSFSSQNLSISTSWPIQKCRCYALLLLTTQRSSRMHNKWGRITRLALFPVEKFEHLSHLFGVNINQGQLEVTNCLLKGVSGIYKYVAGKQCYSSDIFHKFGFDSYWCL